jgi:hypothetical protein
MGSPHGRDVQSQLGDPWVSQDELMDQVGRATVEQLQFKFLEILQMHFLDDARKNVGVPDDQFLQLTEVVKGHNVGLG